MSLILRGQCTHSTRRITVRVPIMDDWPFEVKEEQVITIGGATLYIELSHQEGSPVYQEAVAEYQSRKASPDQPESGGTSNPGSAPSPNVPPPGEGRANHNTEGAEE